MKTQNRKMNKLKNDIANNQIVNKSNFNTWEFNEAKNLVSTNPKKAKEAFEIYLTKYPKDYIAYTHYILLLVKLGELDKAEKIYNYIQKIVNNDLDYKWDDKSKKFELNMIYCQFNILSFQERYKELYHFYINHRNLLDDNENNIMLLYLKIKLCYEDKNKKKPQVYFKRQLFDYSEDEFREHIKKHLFEYNENIEIPNPAVFDKNFPINDIICEIKKYIPSNNKICTDYIKNIYTFKYDECGRVNGKMVNYFRVTTLNNSTSFITTYPADNVENFDYIDLNYLNTKEEEKVKIKSQIEKFNARYHR